MIQKEFGKHSYTDLLSPKIKPPYNYSVFVLVMCILLQRISNPSDFVKYISKKMSLWRKELISDNLLLRGKIKKVLSHPQVCSLEQRARNAHDHNEQNKILHESSVAGFPANKFAGAHANYWCISMECTWPFRIDYTQRYSQLFSVYICWYWFLVVIKNLTVIPEC